jgi:aflatoxin B1 aldehyde reductase
LYNAVSRRAGDELLPDLAEIGMRFHAYNPLARGAFAPRFESRQAEPGSGWDPDLPQGQLYCRCTSTPPSWRPSARCARPARRPACRRSPRRCAGWCTTRCCAARPETGSSWGPSPAHLIQNLAAVTEGPLPGRRDQRHRRRRRNCPPKLAAGLAHHLTQTLSRATAAPQNRVIGFTTYVGVAR